MKRTEFHTLRRGDLLLDDEEVVVVLDSRWGFGLITLETLRMKSETDSVPPFYTTIMLQRGKDVPD